MKHLTKLSFLVIASAVTLASCGKSSPSGSSSSGNSADSDSIPKQETSVTDTTVVELTEEVTSAPSTSGAYILSGTVAGKEVGAMFEIAESGIVRGGYHYGKGTSGDMIELKGAFDASDNSMVVKEEYNGKVTGTWDLTLIDDNAGNITLTGTMTNFKGNTYPVLLSTGEMADEVAIAPAATSSANNIDEFLDEYENYVNRLSSLSKRAMSGDVSALNEYQSLMTSAERLDSKLANLKGEMTPAQTARLNKIIQKAAGM